MLGGNQQPDDPTGGEVPPKDIVFTTAEIDKYKIIYDADLPALSIVANNLKYLLRSKYNESLLVGMDESVIESEYEILIGDTNRYTEDGKIMEYTISVVDKKLKIDVGGLFSAEKALEYLEENVFNTKNGVTLVEGEVTSKSLLISQQAVTNGTTIRVMSSNVLAEAFDNGSYLTTEYRAEIFAGGLVAFTPDVVGMQETDSRWENNLDRYLDKIESAHGIKYERYWARYEGKVNYTSLLYRADKFTVGDESTGDAGVEVFSWWVDPNFNHDYHMRNVSWAKFTSISDQNKTFVLANTHWSYRTEHDGGNKYLTGSSKPIQTNELRTQNKDETNALLTALKNKYKNTPIFLTGDFNTSLPFFTDSGWLNSSYKVLSEQAKSAGTLIGTVPTSGHFDHIMGTGNYSVLRFEIFKSGNYVTQLSDHPLVFADVAF